MDKQHRYFIKLAYNGRRYLGWQIQKQGPTVQGIINEALSAIFRTEINVAGCGRTDTGVHARVFYAHFNLPTQLSDAQRTLNVKKLNGYLPGDIVVFDLLKVKPDANARFDALSRTYKYHILIQKDPFQMDSAYPYFSPLDLEIMESGAKILLEYIDFTSFSKVNTQVKTNNCRISSAQWQQERNLLIFTITADRFLRNMVRAIVGTLMDMGKGKLSQTGLRHVIESKNRAMAGYSVPAQGLYLHAVEYPADIFITR